MKKKMLTALLGLFTAALWAQDDQSESPKPIDERKHELRLDAIEALAIPNIEINYEYVLSRYSGVGAAINIGLEDSFNEYQAFALTPFYRQYFFNKKEYGARGFFVEGMLQFAFGKEEFTEEFAGIPDREVPGFITTDESWFNTGIGIAVGQKWVSNNGFVFELSIGGGRYLLSPDFGPEGFFRGGLLVGYRF
ncbi:hypothetical protein [Gilvibacter sediminis]|uniref:hypothetical protein n=1 Tax=Gilvibacter sediminis TaxID=379071 RepID=UPI00234FFEB5|nr:hypothetical protein [Gilvibacter sediminis]MDC7999222.1 hypothetical protein [Gilvibacter sediminis]